MKRLKLPLDIDIDTEKTGIAFIEVGSRKCRDFWRHPVLLLSQDAKKMEDFHQKEWMGNGWAKKMGLNSQLFKNSLKKSFDLAKFRPVFGKPGAQNFAPKVAPVEARAYVLGEAPAG